MSPAGHRHNVRRVNNSQQETLKVLRWEKRDKRLVIKDAEVMA